MRCMLREFELGIALVLDCIWGLGDPNIRRGITMNGHNFSPFGMGQNELIVYLCVCFAIWFFTKGKTRRSSLIYWHLFLLIGYLFGFENLFNGFGSWVSGFTQGD